MWLPCIRRGNDRWWLPVSRKAAELLASVLVAGPDASTLLPSLTRRLRRDPPLLIFAVLEAAPRHAGTQGIWAPGGSINLSEAARRLQRSLADLYSCGDAALAPPAQSELPLRWQELRRRFADLSPGDQIRAAADWLELTGPEVPRDWQRSWPKVVDDSGNAPDSAASAAGRLDLAALARMAGQHRRLSDRFDDAVREAKRAALKQFAYGLSHEINNPLANISTRAQGLARDEADEVRKKSLSRIVDQAMRAHEMVADLMFYAHPREPHLGAVELGVILRRLAKQAEESVADRGIRLVVDESSNAAIVADAEMIAEAVRALVRNAIEAIGCDGEIRLTCEMVASEPEHDASRRAVITVADSGPGLSEAARIHAFDPYFSGREAGRGLGVGLCRVERIAQLHGGGVSLQSGPAGCVASLWIPATT